MKVEFLVLADAVEVADGKLFVLGGGWTVWRSGVYPGQALLGIGGSILVESNEAGTNTAYPLNITIADEAGIPIVPPLKAHFQVGKNLEAPNGASQRVPFAFNAGVRIPRAGRYFINALAGSTSRAQVFFDAIFVGIKVDLTPSTPSAERGN
ncbi:DUF6941 family protein [Candidatus Binatus sp.]|uniref:DUF6941 family protein n=1 Tax=Candidatus Binatus sp. TaxID=2811406 RepID=UPI003C70E570